MTEQSAASMSDRLSDDMKEKMRTGAGGTVVGGKVRTFETGATRDLDDSKHDYEGFLSPLVLEAFGAYMHFNRQTAEGMRDSDNWQKGIPRDQYIKSAWRHMIDWWKEHRGHRSREGLVWALTGLMFNVMGYLHELLKEDPDRLTRALEYAENRRMGEKPAQRG